MPRLFIPSTLRGQVLPEDGIPCDGLESNTHPLVLLIIFSRVLSTLQKLAPSSLFRIRHLDSRELGPATFTISLHVNIERGDTVLTPLGAFIPVIVMPVITAGAILLRPQPLNMQIRVPALEGSCAVLDTPHYVIPL